MSFSKIGFGSYRISIHAPEHQEALRYALDSGIRLIDTSANYMNGDSERCIGKIVAESMIPREQITIVSKGGYIQGDNWDRMQRGEEVKDLVPYMEGCYHSIHPEFLSRQIGYSLDRLQTSHIDCYLLHNPEYYLMHTIKKGIDPAPHQQEMQHRIREAFLFLEQECQNGRIKSYGISSNSFARHPSDSHFLEYRHLLDYAREAGGEEHHFQVIQLPYNLFETEGEPALKWARDNGLKTLINRPLNAFDGQQMYRLADYPAPENYEEARQALIQEAKSGGLHMIAALPDEIESMIDKIPWVGSVDEYLMERLIPHIREMIARHPARLQIAEALNRFLPAFAQLAKARHNQPLRSRLPGIPPEIPVEQYALQHYLAHPSIDTILLGMRHPRYVDSALSALKLTSSS